MARPKSSDPTEQTGISLTCSEWEYVDKWLPGGNRSVQVRQIIQRAKRMWPGGPFDNSASRRTGVPRPGGKIALRRRIKDLEAKLRAAGMDP